MKTNKQLKKFIKYAKDEFDYKIKIKKSNKPDTFKSIFGISIKENKNIIITKFKLNDQVIYYNNNCNRLGEIIAIDKTNKNNILYLVNFEKWKIEYNLGFKITPRTLWIREIELF